MIAQGREAEVYSWGDGAVLKLYRDGYGGHVTEAAVLGRLAGTGVAPRLLHTVEVDGRHGLVMQRLDGLDMLTLLQRKPWRLASLARMLARAALRIHRVQAPPGLPDLTDALAERIQAADLEPRLRAFALKVLGTLPSGDRLCHGDFHPGNAVVTAAGVSIIDWASATRGVPSADYARVILLLTRADPLPGTPLMFRALLAAGRAAFARAFARTYRAGTTEPLEHLDKWAIVHAAARLAEGIPAETARLTSILNSAYRPQ